MHRKSPRRNRCGLVEAARGLYSALHGLSAWDLPETEFGAKFAGTKQDPYLKVKMAGRSAKTWDADGAGTECVWEGEELELLVPKYAMEWKRVEIEVWNENAPAPDTLIGRAKVRVRDLLRNGQLDVDGSTVKGCELKKEITLSRPKKGFEGKVAMTVAVDRCRPQKRRRVKKTRFSSR